MRATQRRSQRIRHPNSGKNNMKISNTLILSAALVLLCFGPACSLAAAGSSSAKDTSGHSSDPEVIFRWAFAAMSGQDGKQSMLPVTQDMALKSGDQLKMMVELERRCFVYIFHHNQQDGIKMLFPYALQQFEGDYQPNRRYYIPRGDVWFRLDKNPGREVFYLIASAKRLDELEKAYLRYNSAEAGFQSRDSRSASRSDKRTQKGTPRADFARRAAGPHRRRLEKRRKS